jgi:hypothetical protein
LKIEDSPQRRRERKGKKEISRKKAQKAQKRKGGLNGNITGGL